MPSPLPERAVLEDRRLLELLAPSAVLEDGVSGSQSRSRSVSRSLIERVRVGDSGVRGVLDGSSGVGGRPGVDVRF